MKMKKLIKVFFIGIMLITISSCSDEYIYEKMPVEEFEVSENIYLKKEELHIENEILSKPEQIISDGEYLYICDSENNRILKCGLNGESPCSIGCIGNGKCEFIKPKCIAINSENICVYDYGNKRIQIISKTGEFIKEYLLDDFNHLSYVTDVEITDNNSVYFSIISFNDSINEAGIYKATDEGYVLIKDLAVSNLGKDNDSKDVFYILKCELKNKSEWGSGYSEIGRISERNVSIVAAVSNFYSPVDIALVGDNIYVWDNAFKSIDKFSINGKYTETIYNEPINNEIKLYYGFCADYQGNFYISDRDSNKIYKLIACT